MIREAKTKENEKNRRRRRLVRRKNASGGTKKRTVEVPFDGNVPAEVVSDIRELATARVEMAVAGVLHN